MSRGKHHKRHLVDDFKPKKVDQVNKAKKTDEAVFDYDSQMTSYPQADLDKKDSEDTNTASAVFSGRVVEKKSKRIWFYAAGAILVITIVGLIGISISAGQITENYKSDTTKYLEDVYANFDSDRISKVRDAISEVEQPRLASIWMADVVNGSYKDCVDLAETIDSKIQYFSDKLDGYALVYDFEVVASTAVSQIKDLQEKYTGVEYFEKVLDYIQSIQDVITSGKDVIPSELEDNFANISDEYETTIDIIKNIIKASKNDDQNKVDELLQDYADLIANSTNTDEYRIVNYYYDLNSKVKTLRLDLREYIDSLDEDLNVTD